MILGFQGFLGNFQGVTPSLSAERKSKLLALYVLYPKKKTVCNKKIVDTSELRGISKDIHTGIDNHFVPEVYRKENAVCPGQPEDI